MFKLKHTVKRENDDDLAQLKQELAELKRLVSNKGTM